MVSNVCLAADASQRKLCFERDDEVWIANIDGSGEKKIGRGQSPDLSPDGTQLAYNTVQVTGQPAHRQIAIADLASGETKILKEIPSENAMVPRWSPDGNQLIFDFYANNERRIGVINADGTGFHDVQEGNAKPKNYWSAAWAADGISFFAQDMESLFQLDLNGKVLRKWAIEKIVPHGGMSGDIRLDASPDGKFLLMDVEMAEKERKGWDGPPPSIWMLDLATEKATRLTPAKLYAWDSHWLDAPKSILCLSQAVGAKEPSIYKMSATGEGKDLKLLVKKGRGPGTSR